MSRPKGSVPRLPRHNIPNHPRNRLDCRLADKEVKYRLYGPSWYDDGCKKIYDVITYDAVEWARIMDRSKNQLSRIIDSTNTHWVLEEEEVAYIHQVALSYKEWSMHAAISALSFLLDKPLVK